MKGISAISKFVCDVIAIARDWWRSDRIRISPREGQLLRMRPPCLIRVDGEIVEVRARRVGSTRAGSYLIYDCMVGNNTALFSVFPVGIKGTSRITWENGNRKISLPESEIEFLG